MQRCSFGFERFRSQQCEEGQGTSSGSCSIRKGPVGDAEVGTSEGEDFMERGRSARGCPS